MDSAEGLGALLHLGALTSLLAIAYVRLDRYEPGSAINRTDDKAKSEDLLSRARELAFMIHTHFLKTPTKSRLRNRLFLLAKFADVSMPLGPLEWFGAQSFRLRRAPLTTYFGSHTDTVARVTWATVTTGIFLYIVAGAVFGLCSVFSFSVQAAAFAIFTVALAWTMATGFAARWFDPKATLKIGDAIVAEVDAELKQASDEFNARVRDFKALADVAIRKISERRDRSRASGERSWGNDGD